MTKYENIIKQKAQNKEPADIDVLAKKYNMSVTDVKKLKRKMEKISPSKLICPACMGNGYRKIFKDTTSKLRVVIDCEACDNQGEIKNDEKNIFAMRYLHYML